MSWHECQIIIANGQRDFFSNQSVIFLTNIKWEDFHIIQLHTENIAIKLLGNSHRHTLFNAIKTGYSEDALPSE
ncbi:hypothetical protein THF1C08_30034 [Vibrio jasicida]|uniref:Uncharacterized protein n=1 Tax=Vibrio jasicida TaxID=766224 RepID=A0AAU9QRV1_9VIBR|nr:hypothetical protein THF1C08_30034 [Vibrio jasicida]CAH1600061.1 hypothetical protein THF1A12_40400 [Vibrio jasicida]